MDVILFLLKAITKLTLALTGAVVAVAAFLLGKLTGNIVNRAQQPVLQQEAQPKVHPPQPASVPEAVGVSPAVQVHVHIDQTPATRPSVSKPEPAPAYGNATPPTVLSQPDHRIYITTGSHLMMEHPACDDLLQRLDEILYRAAFRDGDPFTVAPPLDDTRHGRTVALELPPLAAVDEDEFFNSACQPLPVPDGALWFRRAGQKPQKLEKTS